MRGLYAAFGAAAAGYLGQDDAGGDGGVEGVDAGGHGDGHRRVAGLLDQAGQAAAFGADHHDQRGGGQVEVVDGHGAVGVQADDHEAFGGQVAQGAGQVGGQGDRQ